PRHGDLPVPPLDERFERRSPPVAPRVPRGYDRSQRSRQPPHDEHGKSDEHSAPGTGSGLGPGRRHDDPALRRAGGRLGRAARGREGDPPADVARAFGGRAAPGQPAGRLRLSRLRLARSPPHLLVRVLRERRQGGGLGGHLETRHARILRPPHALGALGVVRPCARERGTPHASAPYDARQDKYVPVSWEEAAERIGAALRALPDPRMAEFYTSGRASNEAAFLYQLFVREYGCNNFPDCANMCHEATSVGLPSVIGVGKGTVSLADFDQADLVLSIGHNPGTNHPRMLGTLRQVALRGVPIVVLNPMPERGLERFTSPQDP